MSWHFKLSDHWSSSSPCISISCFCQARILHKALIQSHSCNPLPSFFLCPSLHPLLSLPFNQTLSSLIANPLIQLLKCDFSRDLTVYWIKKVLWNFAKKSFCPHWSLDKGGLLTEVSKKRTQKLYEIPQITFNLHTKRNLKNFLAVFIYLFLQNLIYFSNLLHC